MLRQIRARVNPPGIQRGFSPTGNATEPINPKQPGISIAGNLPTPLEAEPIPVKIIPAGQQHNFGQSTLVPRSQDPDLVGIGKSWLAGKPTTPMML